MDIQLQPGQLEPIKNEVQEYLYRNQTIQIASQADYLNAGDIRKQIKNKIKIVEEKRREYTSPLDEAKKRIMADFKGIIEPMEEFINKLDAEMLNWHRAEQARLDAEQKRIEEEALKKAKEQDISEVSVPVVNDIKTQRGDIAVTTVKKVWKWKLADISKVSLDLLEVNEVKVNSMVRDGVRNIPGLEIYQEEYLASR